MFVILTIFFLSFIQLQQLHSVWLTFSLGFTLKSSCFFLLFCSLFSEFPSLQFSSSFNSCCLCLLLFLQFTLLLFLHFFLSLSSYLSFYFYLYSSFSTASLLFRLLSNFYIFLPFSFSSSFIQLHLILLFLSKANLL